VKSRVHVSCKTKNTRYYKHLPLVASLQQRKHRAYGSVLQFTSNVWDVYNDVLLSAWIDRRATNKTTVQRLVLSRNFSLGDVPLTLVFLRIVTVPVSVVVALCEAVYASAHFNYEISPGFREGTPITAIVFVSVFIPLFIFLVATGAWLLNRTYTNPPDSNCMTEVSCAIHRPDTRGAVSCREVGKPVTEAPDSVRPRSIYSVGSIPRRSFTASRNFCLHPR